MHTHPRDLSTPVGHPPDFSAYMRLPPELWHQINWFTWPVYIQESFEKIYQKILTGEEKYWISQLMQSPKETNKLEEWYQAGCPLMSQPEQTSTPSASP